ncbi:YcxB family protein [Bacillus sp. FJAT-27445]|uniref:YcxB family protein n=1 Tax=Bacillus sp. FJAT-27445 TaxID=1679166 RepID=UPI0007431C58|nr:YcxB family protein [Bacillus sp. FJAT-27445]
METAFQNEYTVTKERFMEWAKNPIQRNCFFIFWIFFTLVTAVLSIYYLFIHDTAFSSFYLLLSVYCVYRGFLRTRMFTERQYKALTIIQQAKEWNRVIKFADTITVYDGNNTMTLEWNQIVKLIDQKNELILVFSKGMGIRLDKSGFTKGSQAEFLESINNKNIPITKRK